MTLNDLAKRTPYAVAFSGPRCIEAHQPWI